jgi:nitrogen fixation protein FixH
MTKSRWGIGIAAAIGGFILLIAVLIAVSLSSPTDLVTDRYYERGIAYQDQIAALQRTAAREGKIYVSLAGDTLAIAFPHQGKVLPLSGMILFYRPSDKSRDRSIPVLPDTAGLQRIPTSTFERCLWIVKVAWKEGEAGYYAEQQLMLR